METENLTPEKEAVAEIKAALAVYKTAVFRLDRLLDAREKAAARAKYRGMSFEPITKSRKSNRDKIADSLAAIEEIDKKIKEVVFSLEPCWKQVNDLIDNDRLTCKQKIILIYRYKCGLNWDQISKYLIMTSGIVWRYMAML